MEIYKLSSSDWEEYKKLRLEALQSDPESFGDSYEESSRLHDEEWKKELENPKSHMLVAKEGDSIFAMVAAYQEDNVKMQHMAYIWGVYVRKEYRGQGIGKKLMEKALEELVKNKEIEKVDLNVNTSQLSAVRLYEKLGFVVAGTLHRELKVDGKYYDEYVMEKFLR
jgi:ribosomal protein S18 acetylase RimI-like enzyme